VLASLPALAAVSVNKNMVTDLSPLAGHAALHQLYAQDNQIADVTGLVDLPALQRLYLMGNQISDPTPLAGLSSLTYLHLGKNPLAAGISGLEPLAALEWLEVSSTGITELAAISPATLVSLFAGDNAIVDLSPLAGHTELGYLGLQNNQITTVSPIAAAPFWAVGCASLLITGNPLDVETKSVLLPKLCALDNSVSWDGGGCGQGCEPPPL
jgi:internalin A